VAPSLVSSASYGPPDANASTPVSATSPAIANGKIQTSPFMPNNVPVVTASMMNRSSTMSATLLLLLLLMPSCLQRQKRKSSFLRPIKNPVLVMRD